jgi:uncharacterized membrane protein
MTADPNNQPVGEARWPMASAVVVAMFLTLLLPRGVRLDPTWLLPLIEGVLLVVLIAGDPGSITRRARWLRICSIILVAVLVLSTMWWTVSLIDGLIDGAQWTNSADDLLVAGAAVWLSNTIAFAFLYWELDCGGAGARAHLMPATSDLAFPQQMRPEISQPGWRPRFIDYLYLGVTNAVAFSPTDVMPLTPRAKMTMAVQSMISLAILGLVIARAVNVFA